MTFLTPWTAVLAALVAIPLLVLLYVMKLRRRRLQMASTLLWQKAFEDLQVNTPFQRLRVSLLFAMQLLVLLLLLFAAAEPVITAEGPSASRVILLIDRSASMSAADVVAADGVVTTRFENAKAAARDIVDRLRRGRSGRSVMIIAFAAQPQLVTGFESRRDLLEAAIASIEPTDEEADLAAALQLAGTFVSRNEGDNGAGAESGRPDLVLISDGGVRPPEDQEGFAYRGGPFRFVQAGPDAGTDTRNVGIVSLSARRDYNDPSQVLVFTRLVNSGPEPVETTVTLFVDGTPGPVRQVTIDPAAGEAGGASAGEATVSLAVALPDAAVIGVRHGTRDALPHDDTAAVVLPPPSRPRIALVYAGEGPDPFLEKLLEETAPRVLRPMSAAAFEADLADDAGLTRRFDLLVFDGVTPSRFPPVPSLTFGAALPGTTLTPSLSGGGRRIMSWRRQHALMRHVALDPVVYTGSGAFMLPPEATPLATGRDGPVIALLSGAGAAHVQVAFRLGRSNWPTHVSVTVFMQNVLEYLTLSRSGQSSVVARPGEATAVRYDGSTREIVVSGPSGESIEIVPGEPGARVTLPALRQAGLYTVTGVVPPHDRIAVSMLSDVESDTRPVETLVVNAEPITAGGTAAAAPRGAWPWFVIAALATLTAEWLLYCRLARH